MLESIYKFISDFLHGSQDQAILIILTLLIVFFFLITFILFLVTIYLRISNSVKEIKNRRRCKKWDAVILDVMDASISAYEGYKKIKKPNSIGYLLYLELYIDMVKGKEKEHLLSLGKLSLKKLHALLQSNSRKKQLYGVHLLGLFHPEEQYQYLHFNSKDPDYTLTMIREMRTIEDIRVKEKLIGMLFLFKYISPVYISNILVDMGEDIIPILRMLVRERKENPYEQIIAIETIRRMHYSGCLDLSREVLQNSHHPIVLTSSLRYLEEMGDETFTEDVKPFIVHPNSQVRTAAIEAYIELKASISVDDIKQFFNDSSVQVAVNAAKKLGLMDSIPYFTIEEIDEFKWADIYKQMVY
ncbi:MAG: HEAT repeat domain-containing protein [Candidatus Marinimicrobia bacterium]|nr:HEAT repeat domain-containing protein [Candidatus Neomarinimicrobiota bacterium]